MSQGSSYRQILRSSSIIGGASVINILVGLLRMKVAAVVLGPAGVGLIGLLQQVMTTAVTISGMGMSQAGTRQIAEAAGNEDHAALANTRRALVWATSALAMAGGFLLWMFKAPLAEIIINDPAKSDMVGWLSLGVILSVAAGSQIAMLNGMRRIKDIARITIFSALLSALIGAPAIITLGDRGILFLIISAPLASFVAGHIFVSRLPKTENTSISLFTLKKQWKNLFQLGSSFMIAGLSVVIGQLAVRALVQNDLGSDALGYFTAAWAISMTYISFVLAAMGTDFFPRLTAVIHDRESTNRLVNDQIEVALYLAGPILLGMMALAPWAIELLYSKAFAPAVEVLRWQIMGDVLKLASWPLGFIILAAAAGRTFILTEGLAIFSFVLASWALMPLLGIEATGIAFIIMYTLYLPVVYWLARHRTGFKLSASSLLLLSTLLLACGVTLAISLWDNQASMMIGILFAAGYGYHSFNKLGIGKLKKI